MRSIPTAGALLLVALLTGGQATAQSILRNLNAVPPLSPASSQPALLGEVGGYVYFSAADRFHGRELWRSDGTPSGTELVIDLWPGTTSGLFPNYGLTAAANGTVYFVGGTAGYFGLWKSDGTAAGTVAATQGLFTTLVAPDTLLAVGTGVYFWATDGVNGFELWRTDGTPGSTVMVADINPNGDAYDGRSKMQMLEVNGIVFFRADDGTNGIELWRTDGTTQGTWMVADVNPGSPDARPDAFVEQGGRLLFAAQSTGNFSPYRWWLTDPSTTTATQVSGIEARVTQAGTAHKRGGYVYFAGYTPQERTELWRTDGTAAGTTLVKDINPAANGSSVPGGMVVYAGDLFFGASDGERGYELWRSDGTAAGTQIVVDLEPGRRGSNPTRMKEHRGKMFFAAATLEVGAELFVTDGTAGGTRVVYEIQPGGGSASITGGPLVAANGVVFAGDDGQSGVNGEEPWVSDGTVPGTTVLANIAIAPSSSNPTFIGSHRNLMFMSANDGLTGDEPWVSDGTSAGTRQLVDVDPGPRWGSMFDITKWRNEHWFTSSKGMYRTDGTPAGTRLAVSGSSMRDIIAYNDKLYFSGSNNGLWESNGSPVGTRLVQSFAVGVFYPVGPGLMTVAGGKMYFTASGGAFSAAGVWVSDGTSAGTTLVVPIGFNLINATHIEVVPFRNGVLVATPGWLWFTDGTTTTQLAQWGPLLPFTTSPVPDITVVADGAFFVAEDPTNGFELWRTDGTVTGTQLVADINPGAASSDPASLAAAGGLLWFAANDGQNGVELWSSDGTPSGTAMVADSWPGSTGSLPSEIAAAGSGARVVYSATDPVAGRELWLSDGTPGGTARLADLSPGSLPSSPAGFARVGTTIYFAAEAALTGREPWVLQLATTGGNLTETYGGGCPGTNGLVPTMGTSGLPTLGNLDFRVEVSNALPAAPAAMLIARTPAAFPLGGGCELLLGSPLYTVPWVVDPAGMASRPSGVGNNPALLGVELRYQWIVGDPQGAFLGLVSISDALHVMYGS